MFKKKSAIQISIEGNKNKSVEVPTIIVKYWKHIALASTALLIVLIGGIAHFAAKQRAEDISKKYAETFNKINNKNRKISSSQQASKKELADVKKSLEKIDSTIEAINYKMQRRGLKTIAMANSGGPVEKDNEDIALLSEYYTRLLADVDKKLSSMPIGRPHSGDITSGFGYRRNPFTNQGREIHSGIDFRGSIGDPVRVTADGDVTFAGYEGDYGYVVKVKHSNGYETRYAHLIRTQVKQGQKVIAGSVVGLLGNTGRSTGPHLHYEVIKDNVKINPAQFLEL